MWIVAHTAPRAEAAVVQGLTAMRYQTFWPHYRKQVCHAKQRAKETLVSLFPRYVFVRVVEAIYDVTTHAGVYSVLSMDGRPAEIPPGEIEYWQQSCVDETGCLGWVNGKDPERVRYAVGQPVRVIEGPLTGYDANVHVDNGASIRLNVALFQGRVEAELPPEAVKPRRP